MGSMKPADVAQFVERMKSENYAPGTCNRALVLLRYGFELAIRWHTEGVKSNPAKEIKNIQKNHSPFRDVPVGAGHGHDLGCLLLLALFLDKLNQGKKRY